MREVGLGFLIGRASSDQRLIYVLAAFVLALISAPIVIAALRWVQLMDHPNARSSHTKATVRGAGWSVIFGVVIVWISSGVAGPIRWWLPLTAVSFGLIGFADDLRSLPAKVRLALQLAVSCSAVLAAARYEVIGVNLGYLPIFAAMVVAYVNAFNFMDGVNAISGLQAAVVGGVLAIAGARVDALYVEIAGLCLTGASLGFLPFNGFRARCFLGDVGSYFIGSWIALTSIAALESGVSPLVVASAMAIYAFDTAYTLFARVRRGERWWASHREHVYQRLTDLGWSHIATSALVTIFTALAATVGLLAADHGGRGTVVGASGVALIGFAYLMLPALVGRRAQDRQETRRVGVG